jgi:hypothetical protein
VTILKIGADPELFLQNEKGEFVSAHDILPGNKYDPHEVVSGAVQVDGTAAEFNINPAKSAQEFVDNIKDVIDQMAEMVTAKVPGLTLVASPVAEYTPAYFSKLPRMATRMGCDPDFNAWLGGIKNHPPSGKAKFRTGGGHIHLGWTSGISHTDVSHFNDCIEMTKQLDAALFIPSLLWDDNNKRRELYGKAGAFRAKHYGVEYRPLSNAWVADPALCEWVFAAAHEAWHMLDQEDHKLWTKNEFQDILEPLVSDGKMPSHADTVTYVKNLTEWGFPHLPDEYMNRV